MKIVTKTVKRGNSYKTEYRISSGYIDTYGKVSDLIDELQSYVDAFPEELRPLVSMDLETDSHYAEFFVEGPASKSAADAAKAKEKREKEDWLARAVKRRAELDAQIAQMSKEV